jgi:hypothetical protein
VAAKSVRLEGYGVELTKQSFVMVFGRFSVAIVTPFEEALSENSQQSVNEESLEILIRSVMNGLSKARSHLQEQGAEDMIGGFGIF